VSSTVSALLPETVVDERHDDETNRQTAIPSYLNSINMPVTMW
jgi:hypothetical protein